ncbi:hypothetical protein [Massilia sp. GCM10023247]|uniref:hypothetical protein n=1 Tax=Massilia sp. GCM10023247 TaxID=3252643 RepID=UPI003614A398
MKDNPDRRIFKQLTALVHEDVVQTSNAISNQIIYGGNMPAIAPSTIEAASGIDPLNLAILLLGVVALGVIWLAAIAVRSAIEVAKNAGTGK